MAKAAEHLKNVAECQEQLGRPRLTQDFTAAATQAFFGLGPTAPHCSRLRLPRAYKQCRKARVQMLLRNKIAVRKHTVINMELNQARYRTQGGLPHK